MSRTEFGEPPAGLKQAAKEYGQSLFMEAERRRQDAKNRGMSKLLNMLNRRTCLGCGARTDENGDLPCGH